MFEELYAPVPDVGLYLERIGAEYPKARTREFLDTLIRRHQLTVPFENLDVFVFRKTIDTGTDHLFDKIVRQGRGGFCFEMNALFFALLRTLGFDAWPCLCKVKVGEGPYYPADHRGIIVRMEDRLIYCDIGCGGPVPIGSVELAADRVQRIREEAFRMVPAKMPYNDKNWWKMNRFNRSGKEETILFINPNPFDPCDFLARCHYVSCHEQQVFTRFTSNLLLNIRTETGYAAITNNILKQRDGTRVTETVIRSEDEMKDAMIRLFYLPESFVRNLDFGRVVHDV